MTSQTKCIVPEESPALTTRIAKHIPALVCFSLPWYGAPILVLNQSFKFYIVQFFTVGEG